MKSLPKLGLETINIAPLWKGWSYQSTYLEFRCRDGKVLGTRPMGRPSLIVFQVLILLKTYLTRYSNSRTL